MSIWIHALAQGLEVASIGFGLAILAACAVAWCCADWQAEEFTDGEHEANDSGRADG